MISLELEPDDLRILMKILSTYEEMMSDDKEDEEEEEDALALCEVLQDRIAYLL